MSTEDAAQNIIIAIILIGFAGLLLYDFVTLKRLKREEEWEEMERHLNAPPNPSGALKDLMSELDELELAYIASDNALMAAYNLLADIENLERELHD